MAYNNSAVSHNYNNTATADQTTPKHKKLKNNKFNRMTKIINENNILD